MAAGTQLKAGANPQAAMAVVVIIAIALILLFVVSYGVTVMQGAAEALAPIGAQPDLQYVQASPMPVAPATPDQRMQDGILFPPGQ